MKANARPHHAIILSNEYKVTWFETLIGQRQSIQPLEGEEQTKEFLRTLREFYVLIHVRDVPGYFIRKIAEKCGLPSTMSATTVIKRHFAFDLMDKNEHYRDNKTDLVRAMFDKFGEKTLNYIIDDLWNEWHDQESHPAPVMNKDVFGQEALFD